MKQQIFYIHGGEAFRRHEDFIERLKIKGIWDLPSLVTTEKWNDRFRADLGDAYEVFMPQMPNRQNAQYEEWKIWFERHFEHLHDGVILVGCSLGAMFLLKYLQAGALPVTVKATILMAAPIGLPGFDDRDCFEFLTPVASIRPLLQAGAITIMHSTDDFLVPYEHAVALKAALPEAELITFSDKNHFLVPELPELVAYIKGLG
jgi:uncharacterized protein